MPSFLRSFSLTLLTSAFLVSTGCNKSGNDPQPTAKVESGAVTGTFTPANGLGSVTATPVGGGTAYTASLSTPGSYTFSSLPVGSYTLVYTGANGYQAPPSQTITVVANSSLPLPALTLVTDRFALLTTRKWRITASTTTYVTAGQTTVTDHYPSFSYCQTDDFYRFNTDLSIVRDEGPTKCATHYPQTQLGSWRFVSNETEMIFFTSRHSIRELTATTLELNQVFTNGGTTRTEKTVFTAF